MYILERRRTPQKQNALHPNCSRRPSLPSKASSRRLEKGCVSCPQLFFIQINYRTRDSRQANIVSNSRLSYCQKQSFFTQVPPLPPTSTPSASSQHVFSWPRNRSPRDPRLYSESPREAACVLPFLGGTCCNAPCTRSRTVSTSYH